MRLFTGRQARSRFTTDSLKGLWVVCQVLIS